MNNKCKLAVTAILSAIIVMIAAPIVAQGPANYEVRTKIVDPTDGPAAGRSADATHQHATSNMRRPYVCPYCGYSSTVSGDCPNPYEIGDHPANVELVYKPVGERVLNVATARRANSGDDPPMCDIEYRGTNIPSGGDYGEGNENQFKSVIGRPFNPNGGASEVFAEMVWPDVPDNDESRVHFLTLPAGTRRPMVYRNNYEQNFYTEDWAQPAIYFEGGFIEHNNQKYRCIADHLAWVNPWTGECESEPGVGSNWTGYWEEFTPPHSDLVRIGLNSHRAAEGDWYFVRYICGVGGWRIWVYSGLYGLEFDSGVQTGAEASEDTEYIRIVTGSGSALLTFPFLSDPDDGAWRGLVWEFKFQTHSNCRMTPQATEAEQGQPPDWGNPDPTVPGAATNPDWHNAGVYLEFEGDNKITNVDGIHSANDTQADIDVGDASPYTLKQGETGPGRVEVHWHHGLNGDEVWDLDPDWETGDYANTYLPDGIHGDDEVLAGWYPHSPTNEDPAWYYAYSIGDPDEELPRNEGVRWMPWEVPGDTFGGSPGYARRQSRYFASRYDVQPTGDVGHHGSLETPSEYPRMLLGSDDGTATVVHPGETSSKSEFNIANRLTQGEAYYVCPACGKVFDEAQDHGAGFAGSYATSTWTDGDSYYPGDKVTNAGNTYVCTRAHIAAAGENEPGSGGEWQPYWGPDSGSPDWYPEDKGFGVCPYHGDHTDSEGGPDHPSYWAAGDRVGLVRIEPGAERVDCDMIKSLIAPEIATDGGGPISYLASFPNLRPHIPQEKVDIGVQGGHVPPGTDGGAAYASVKVPPRQPSSEPAWNNGTDSADAGEPGNSPGYIANWGYRGGAVGYHQAHGSATVYDDTLDAGRRWSIRPHNTIYGNNDQWDSYYVCPDCGKPYDGEGTVPFQCDNPDCPGHEFCPVCGASYPAGTSHCPFDGQALTVVDPEPDGSGDNNIAVTHIAAEEFDALDLQVTVPKRTQVVAESDAAAMGRVGPGIEQTPDTTVADAGGTPAGRRPEPAGFSRGGNFAVRNEGNTTPSLITVTPGASGYDNAWYRMFRSDADQTDWQDPLLKRGYGWATIRNPIARDLAETYRDADGVVPLAPGGASPWQPVTRPAGPDAGTNAAAGTQRGSAGGPLVPAGQVLGRYSGPQIYFMDMNDNGALDFNRPGASSNPVDSTRYVFNPDRDQALEPCITVRGRLRVSEARLPFNEYQCTDTAPVGVFSYDANGNPEWLRVTWMTNDPDPTATGSAPSNAMNLAYGAADVTSAGPPPEYDWNFGSVNSWTTGGGTLSQAGPVDSYAYPDGYVTLWTSTQRTAGGLQSAIRYTDASGNGVIWSGQERVGGVRGFYDPDQANDGDNPAHWTFWHGGPRGHERIMYAVNSETGLSDGGQLPVDNAISPADPARTVETFYDSDGPLGPGPSNDVTIQKFPRGPFTRVKDVSPMLYLPPVVYQTGSSLQPMIRVFFAGNARHLQNFDIYEARFNRADLLRGENNDGKIEFRHVGSGTVPGVPEGLPSKNPTEQYGGAEPGTVQAEAPGDHAGEEFTAESPLRQAFHSRHLDWVIGDNFVNGGGPGVSLTIGVKRHHTTYPVHYYDIDWGPVGGQNAGDRRARGEMYDPKRGVYRVIPRICRHKEDDLFTDLSNWTWPDGPCAPEDNSLPHVKYYESTGPNDEDEYELIDPATYSLPDAQKRPLMLEIDPVLGRIRFASPLFNSQDAADKQAVFTEWFDSISGTLEGVFVAGYYSPFLWRHTTSQADDDSPSAFLQSGGWLGNNEDLSNGETYDYPWSPNSHNNRVVLFWRRSFRSGQAPYHGRTCYLMKLQSWTFQVHHPPIVNPNNLIVRYPGTAEPYPELHGPGTPQEIVGDLPDHPNLPPGDYTSPGGGGTARAEFGADMQTGEIAIWRGVYRWVEYLNGDKVHATLGPGSTVEVEYDYEYLDENGNVQERTATDETHRIGGWSQETVIPIDTVVSEGPLRVTEETYRASSLPGTQGSVIPARRYWLFWASPRPVYDLRTASSGGSGVRQSSDVYYCTVMPEFPTLVRDERGSSCSTADFRPAAPWSP